MGWEVLGLGNIDVDEKHMEEIVDLMIGDKKEVLDRLAPTGGCDFYEVEGADGNITFKMDGNKGIDYDRLDAIKVYCIDAGISIEINVNEYVEGGDGYYYNSGDIDGEVEK